VGQALDNIRRVAPELAENIHIVRNRDDLDPRHYSPEEWENMQQGEGFYDERDGSTVIFTDNLPPGDGTMDAVGHAERVILHERVGHAGLDALLRGSPYHRMRWDTLVESLPNNDRIRGEMEQISQERGYEHLRENPRALADEWFARTVQGLTPEQLASLKPDTRLGAMWVTFKDMLSRMVLGKTTQAWTDAQVRGLVIKGREALRQPLRPQGDGTGVGPGLRFSRTRTGTTRRNRSDWRQTRDLWDQTGYGSLLSDTNRRLIARGRVPVVDDAWIAIHPEDAGLRGEQVRIHHVQGLPINTPLPKSRHMDTHMPGGFRHNPGGVGSQLPLYLPP